mmetsp:Transcript_9210/g.26371  ORF Transcript_9210/g.26371 Transcript_9210/m.26371 type:complete len:390 (-) Transcript_9210:1026-2195(-)
MACRSQESETEESTECTAPLTKPSMHKVHASSDTGHLSMPCLHIPPVMPAHLSIFTVAEFSAVVLCGVVFGSSRLRFSQVCLHLHPHIPDRLLGRGVHSRGAKRGGKERQVVGAGHSQPLAQYTLSPLPSEALVTLKDRSGTLCGRGGHGEVGLPGRGKVWHLLRLKLELFAHVLQLLFLLLLKPAPLLSICSHLLGLAGLLLLLQALVHQHALLALEHGLLGHGELLLLLQALLNRGPHICVGLGLVVRDGSGLELARCLFPLLLLQGLCLVLAHGFLMKLQGAQRKRLKLSGGAALSGRLGLGGRRHHTGQLLPLFVQSIHLSLCLLHAHLLCGQATSGLDVAGAEVERLRGCGVGLLAWRHVDIKVGGGCAHAALHLGGLARAPCL